MNEQSSICRRRERRPLFDERGGTTIVIGLLAAISAFSLTGKARADTVDTVYLKNGRAVHNVHTRIEGEFLVVTRGGMAMRFPVALVERIEDAEVIENAPRADPAGVEEGAPDPAPEPVDARTTDATTSSSRSGRRRVFLRNEVDQISFELDRSWTVTQRRVSGDTDADEEDWFSMMDPANLLSGEAGEIRYDLLIGLRTVHPNVSRPPEEHARNWLRRVRLAFLDGPMETRRRGEVRTRSVGKRDYSVFRYWHEWSGSEGHQDGMILLFFPRDFEQAHRYYILQYFVSFNGETLAELDLLELDAVVDTFRVQRLR